MFALRPSPSPTLSTTPLSYHISPPSSCLHTPLLTFDNLPTMGDHVDEFPSTLPPVNVEADSAGWLAIAKLHEELEDAKRVITALQGLAAVVLGNKHSHLANSLL